jgi:hypothetical protein
MRRYGAWRHERRADAKRSAIIGLAVVVAVGWVLVIASYLFSSDPVAEVPAQQPKFTGKREVLRLLDHSKVGQPKQPRRPKAQDPRVVTLNDAEPAASMCKQCAMLQWCC